MALAVDKRRRGLSHSSGSGARASGRPPLPPPCRFDDASRPPLTVADCQARRTLPARFVRAPPEGDATNWRPPPLRCRCKLCGEAGRSGIANGRRRAGATRASAWRGNLAPYLTALFEWVEAEPDITTPELAAKSKAEKDMTAHPASLSRLLKAGQSFKKHCWPRRPSVRTCARRVTSGRSHRQPGMRHGVHRLVFLDETGTTTKMTRLRGRGSPLGHADLHRRTAL